MLKLIDKQGWGMKNVKSNQSGFSIVEVLIVLVVVGLIGVVGWFVYDRQNSKSSNSAASSQQEMQQPIEMNQESTVTLEKGTYKGEGENATGTFQAKGYVTVKTEKDPENICDTTCEEREVVSFNVTAVENDTAKKFVNTALSVGCKVGSIINYISSTPDGNKLMSYSHTTEDSKKILGSTSANEIVLEFNQIKFTGTPSEAPACYTLTTTKLVN